MNESTTSTSGPEPGLLNYISLNDHNSTSIILLHGLLWSHRQWAFTTPLLSSYHLLVPDLPGASGTKQHGPFTPSYAADEAAKLIRAHAKNRKCHVVGFSGGGYVGVTLAHKYPELVQSLFVSGVYDLKCWGRLLDWAPYTSVAQSWLPVPLVSFAYARMGCKNPPGLHEDAKANSANLKLQKTMWNSLKDFNDGYPLVMRALVVAGSKQDDLSGTQRLGDMFRTGNEESKAVV